MGRAGMHARRNSNICPRRVNQKASHRGSTTVSTHPTVACEEQSREDSEIWMYKGVLSFGCLHEIVKRQDSTVLSTLPLLFQWIDTQIFSRENNKK